MDFPKNMIVTKVQPFGKYLKVFAQLNDATSEFLKRKLNQLYSMVGHNHNLPVKPLPPIVIDLMILVRRGDSLARGRVTSVNISAKTISAYLLDYGGAETIANDDIVSYEMFKSADSNYLRNAAPLASEYVLAEIMNTNWNEAVMKIIQKDIVGQSFKVNILNEHTIINPNMKFIHLLWKTELTYSIYLAQKCAIGKHVPIEHQRQQILNTFNCSEKLSRDRPFAGVPQMNRNYRTFTPSVMPRSIRLPDSKTKIQIANHITNNVIKDRPIAVTSRLSFISKTLPIGSHHEVYVSFITNGPFLFAMQLKAEEEALDKMMDELANIELHSLTRFETGLPCIARYSEDNNLYRAMILSPKTNDCEVIYVDYGNKETVPFSRLFDIPINFLKHPTFAMNFCLTNANQLEPKGATLNNQFSLMVLDKVLTLKVDPLAGPPSVQYGSLFEKDCNILDFLMQNCLKAQSYPPQMNSLPINSSKMVTITYINSPEDFYIRLFDDAKPFDEWFDKFHSDCSASQIPSNINVNGAYAIEDDGIFYRCKALNEFINDKGDVLYVDYGITREAKKSKLRYMPTECLKHPPQAMKCCLTGFMGMHNEYSKSAGMQMQMLCEDKNESAKTFRMEVLEIKNNIMIVNLFDDSVTPVFNMSSRMYALSMPQKYNAERERVIAKHAAINNENKEKTNEEFTNSTPDETKRFKTRQSRKEQNSPEKSFNNSRSADSFDSAILKSVNSENDSFPERTQYIKIVFDNDKSHSVDITWWVSPHEFYITLAEYKRHIDDMMKEIQRIYKNELPINDREDKDKPVIALDSTSNLLHRGLILAYNPDLNKYRVQLIDTGAIVILSPNKIYKMKSNFMQLPAMAVKCSFGSVITAFDKNTILKKIPNYFKNKPNIKGKVLSHDSEGTVLIDIDLDGKSLINSLISDGIIAELPQINLQEFIGKTMKGQLINIMDLSCFRIKFDECPIPLMCCYKDYRSSNQNSTLLMDFKKRWDSKTIKMVVDSVLKNNVLLVSPQVPPFVEEIQPTTNVSMNTVTLEEITCMNIGYITHVDNPEKFYVQWDKDTDKINQMQENLQMASSLPSLNDFSEGNLCIAKFSFDEEWYRAKIIDSCSDITSIHFIDYGNTDAVIDRSQLKIIDEFANLDAFAQEYSLAIKPINGSEWTDEDCKRITNLTKFEGDSVRFEVIGRSYGREFIRLIDGNSNDVAQTFINDKIAKKINIIKDDENCYVSHFNTLSDFYVQLETDTHALELMCDYLADYEKFEIIKHCDEGEICAGRFEDDCWYRVKVLTQSIDSPEVLFIDYGNTAYTKDLRKLPIEIAELPQLAWHCGLLLPDKVDRWSQEAEEKFSELAQSGATVFSIRSIKMESDISLVKLCINNRNIVEMFNVRQDNDSNHINCNEIVTDIIHDGERDAVNIVNIVDDMIASATSVQSNTFMEETVESVIEEIIETVVDTK